MNVVTPTKIERLRVDQGLTYLTLAERAGIDQNTVARYAQRKVQRPRMLTLKRIADVLGVDVWELAADYDGAQA